jgi:hypothetical protein
VCCYHPSDCPLSSDRAFTKLPVRYTNYGGEQAMKRIARPYDLAGGIATG